MLVCDKNTTIGQLSEMPVVMPKVAVSKQYAAIPHKILVETLLSRMTARSWKVNSTALSVTKDLRGLAGAFDLEVPNLDAPEGQMFSLGFLHDNNCERALRIVVGSRVFVCNNGCVTGEILLKAKHTTGFNLRDRIDLALDTYEAQATNLRDMVEGMKRYELCSGHADNILMEAGRKELMCWSAIGKVDKEYQHPTFQDFAQRTSWGLFNAFTHIVKERSPQTQMSIINRFREMMPIIDVKAE